MRSVYFVALGGALVLNAAANLMMKFGMERFKTSVSGEGLIPILTALASNWILILGLCCFAANVVLYTFALKELPISVAYPIMVTLGFAIIVFVAGTYLHERLSPIQWIGVGLIVVGVWLVASRARAQLGGGPPKPTAAVVAHADG